jgi:ethanolamine utilization protein EutN
MLLVQPVDLKLQATGREVLAVDFLHVAIDELVLLMEEGSSCQQMLNDKKAPVDAAIVGIVDEVILDDGRRVFMKYPPDGPTPG